MAVKLTGEPVTPAEVAVMVLVVAKPGRVTVVWAVPSLMVGPLAGLTAPPAGVIAQNTPRPDTGAPDWVITTRSGLGSVVPDGPDCPSPLVLALAMVTVEAGGGGGGGRVPPPPHPAARLAPPASTNRPTISPRMRPPGRTRPPWAEVLKLVQR